MAIKTLTLVGGISRNSLNKKYFRSIQELSIPHFEFETFDISKLPFFSQDLEMDPPDIVSEFKDLIREAQAVLFISPEYNRSFPGVLKNAIDWGSRPYGQNLWNRKPAALLGASPGAIGTFGAQHHLRQVMAYLNMSVLGQPEMYFNASHAFDEQDRLTNEKTKELLLQYFAAFEEWIRLVGERTEDREDLYPSEGLEDSPMTH
ncbi:NADPH-dependent FMN reductase [Peredibacter starrii]|uniref:NAD(P)H-dependent oxidoreductase n=1 Tax=Peredibacter starrii TaxID=28202 RepID=A0AAX4HVI2_9BACT|nr:NAD(P)H-dependent oxidoreductase [Peredibacter starrii]WPU66969.1 NAD(P)H-dependent oxidoreductase [Peredibacter starrii]